MSAASVDAASVTGARGYVRTAWSARVFIGVDDKESIAKPLIQ